MSEFKNIITILPDKKACLFVEKRRGSQTGQTHEKNECGEIGKIRRFATLQQNDKWKEYDRKEADTKAIVIVK